MEYKYKPFQFFLFANLITWTALFIAAYFSYHEGSLQLITTLDIVAFVAPFAVSLWMIFTSGSTELKRNYFDRLLNLKLIRPASLPGIFLIMPCGVLISVVASWMFLGQSLDQLKISTAPFKAGMIPIPLLMFTVAMLEELGWKGYGVDSLRGKLNFFMATLIYGLLWGFWHIPTFFINGYYQNMIFKENPLYAVNFMVSIVAATFIINWLWYMNKGSILTAVLFHAVTNFQGILMMGQPAKCIQTVLLIAAAAIIVFFNRKIFFSGFNPRIGDYGQGG